MRVALPDISKFGGDDDAYIKTIVWDILKRGVLLESGNISAGNHREEKKKHIFFFYFAVESDEKTNPKK